MQQRFLPLTLLLTSLISFSFPARAQISLPSTGAPVTLTFDAFLGDGFAPSPTAGQLDSDAFAVAGLSDGPLGFGGSGTSGDYARGSSAGGESTGGVYAFETAMSDYSLGVQPTAADFTPGSFTIRYHNNTGSVINSLDVAYEVKVFNNGERSTSLVLSYSDDDATYHDVPSLDFSSEEAADAPPAWRTIDRSVSLFGLELVNGGFLYLRFTIDDAGGSGSQDELALDDVMVTAGTSTPALVINEIHADPATSGGDANGDGTVSLDDDEFIELVNNGSETLDVSGYTLSNGSGVRHTFPSGTALLPSAALVVFGGGAPAGSFGGSIVQTTSSLGLANGGDDVTLKSPTGVTLTSVTYGSEGGDDESLTRDPDVTGSFKKHLSETSAATRFSPGTKLDGSSFSGNLRVLLKGKAGWRMLAPPTGATDVSDLAGQNLVQGLSDKHASASANIYTSYDGTTWNEPGGTSDMLGSGQGFIWYLFNNDQGESVSLPFTLTASGSEPAAAVVVALHSDGDKWNLVGNPFASALDVSGLSSWASGGTLASSIAQIWDPETASYQTSTANADKIAAWQAFFIENTNAGSLTIPTSAKTNGASFFGKRAPVESRLIAFTLAGVDHQSGSTTFDAALLLYFRPEAMDAWDLWDAAKLTPLTFPNATLAFVGMRRGLPILKAQESRPLVLGSRVTIPLAFQPRGIGGDFTLAWPRWDNIPDDWQITLTDQESALTTDLRRDSSYTFSAESPGRHALTFSDRALPRPVEVRRSGGIDPRFLLTITPATSTTVDPAAPPRAHGLELSPNYPNPFHEATTIRYMLPTPGEVRLVLYDVLGRVVATLDEGRQAAGRHAVTWRADGLPGGVYFYRLEAEGQTRVRTLLLIR